LLSTTSHGLERKCCMAEHHIIHFHKFHYIKTVAILLTKGPIFSGRSQSRRTKECSVLEISPRRRSLDSFAKRIVYLHGLGSLGICLNLEENMHILVVRTCI
jgi:hypothetical protein